jgi:hypothetical protein
MRLVAVVLLRSARFGSTQFVRHLPAGAQSRRHRNLFLGVFEHPAMMC